MRGRTPSSPGPPCCLGFRSPRLFCLSLPQKTSTVGSVIVYHTCIIFGASGDCQRFLPARSSRTVTACLPVSLHSLPDLVFPSCFDLICFAPLVSPAPKTPLSLLCVCVRRGARVTGCLCPCHSFVLTRVLLRSVSLCACGRSFLCASFLVLGAPTTFMRWVRPCVCVCAPFCAGVYVLVCLCRCAFGCVFLSFLRPLLHVRLWRSSVPPLFLRGRLHVWVTLFRCAA
jgi:hypothetical protein